MEFLRRRNHISNVEEPYGLVAGKLQYKEKRHEFPSPPNSLTVPNSQGTPHTHKLSTKKMQSTALCGSIYIASLCNGNHTGAWYGNLSTIGILVQRLVGSLLRCLIATLASNH